MGATKSRHTFLYPATKITFLPLQKKHYFFTLSFLTPTFNQQHIQLKILITPLTLQLKLQSFPYKQIKPTYISPSLNFSPNSNYHLSFKRKLNLQIPLFIEQLHTPSKPLDYLSSSPSNFTLHIPLIHSLTHILSLPSLSLPHLIAAQFPSLLILHRFFLLCCVDGSGLRQVTPEVITSVLPDSVAAAGYYYYFLLFIVFLIVVFGLKVDGQDFRLRF